MLMYPVLQMTSVLTWTIISIFSSTDKSLFLFICCSDRLFTSYFILQIYIIKLNFGLSECVFLSFCRTKGPGSCKTKNLGYFVQNFVTQKINHKYFVFDSSQRFQTMSGGILMLMLRYVPWENLSGLRRTIKKVSRIEEK